MRAKMKFGCLVNARSLNAGLHPMSNVRQWEEEYRCERLQYDLPGSGSASVDLACPVCSQQVTLRLRSPGIVYTILQFALLAWFVVCLGLSAILFFGMGPGDPLVQKIAIGIGLVGCAFLVATCCASWFPANWLKESLVSISNDEVRNHAQAPGYSGMRGHKLLELDIS